ncbi:MAG: O-antigen ligase family protein [Fimbriimonadaceae bacterium]|nr:O-antigen ligase family protein [Fimbriimonadaceae bacterium]QYK55413.1 MAG: O-antigen ligase family protein [Fimbriimonadaceae bacterium]
MAEKAALNLRPELGLLCAACVLVPVIGGQVSLDAQPFGPGGIAEGLLGGAQLPFGARLLIGLLVLGGLAIVVLSRRVLQAPNPRLGYALFSLVVVLGLSTSVTAFPYLAYAQWPSWILYACALYLTVAAAGRRRGIRAVLWCLAGAGTLVAVKGILEYAGMRATEPTYRIFADWNNPNALAGLLVVIAPVALGLGLTGERLERLGGLLSTALVLFALALTQSKGGFLAEAVALAAFAGIALAWRVPAKRLAVAAVPLGLAGLLVGGLVATAPKTGTAGQPFARVVAASSTQEQSAGFRTLLWRSAAELVKTRPMGWGLGAFRFESARPGLVSQTHFAHQAYLQTAFEGGVLALALLLVAAGIWLRDVWRGALSAPPDQNLLRAAVVAGVVGVGTHGFVESSLSYFGVAFVVFVLMGAALQLAPDGSQPESTPKPIRQALFWIGCVLPACLLLHTALVEFFKASAETARQVEARLPLRAASERAISLAPFDGEAHAMAVFASDAPQEALDHVREAARWQPSTRYLRLLSDAELLMQHPQSAQAALEEALIRDPNNLSTLERLYKLYRQRGETQMALATAERLVAIEDSVYFKTRAIPELVPLETYDARLFLAERESDPESKRRLLLDAAEGFARFAELTWPLVKRGTEAKVPGGFLGITEQIARDAVARGKDAAEQAARLSAPGSPDAKRAEDLAQRLAID